VSDPGQRAYWTTLIRERFDFIDISTSCASPSGFLATVQSDVGTPGSLPYAGLWRVGPGKPPNKLAEVSDQSPMVSWGTTACTDWQKLTVAD